MRKEIIRNNYKLTTNLSISQLWNSNLLLILVLFYRNQLFIYRLWLYSLVGKWNLSILIMVMYTILSCLMGGYNVTRGVIEEYSEQVVKLCGRLMKILSINLGLDESCLQNAFGGEDIGACLRINFYPKCPQPDLTLGLSSHSDPGGLTILLPDQHVAGLQVRRNDQWITVKPAQHAFIVNIGDQVQVTFNFFALIFFFIIFSWRYLFGMGETWSHGGLNCVLI